MPPTREEFEQARRRELARLNLRLSSITGRTFHTPEDLKLLEAEGPQRRTSDMEVVRRWVASSDKREDEVGVTDESRTTTSAKRKG